MVSFFSCLIVSNIFIDTLLFFETYPFLTFTTRKFIANNVMDLFDTVWLLTISQSFTFIFPYWIYQLYKFNCSSWYKYQLEFFKKSIFISLLSTLVILFITHLIFVPWILQFLAQWEIITSPLLKILIELRVLNYIRWVLAFRYISSSLWFLIFVVLIHLWFLLNTVFVYFLIRTYRKIFVFGILAFLFLLIPPDGLLQFFLVVSIFTLFEVIFFIVCYKINNNFLYYAYIKSIVKISSTKDCEEI
uniref:Sec-independent protein translocase component TatC n=1 Tax=Melanthalia intermedia TaxID=172989 RepID=A0A345UBM9_9FLOR|nr:Sec-independent protein translocase component TatC [Melanthalia intermedia]AXI97865.1 Sec-independent protein translocase component TatC [Melanthalia intermedia]